MIFGFIGSGNMGGAIIGGIINSDIASPENVIVSDKNEQALKNINGKYGVKVTSDNKETADKADVLFLFYLFFPYPEQQYCMHNHDCI